MKRLKERKSKNFGPRITKQEPEADANVNNIVARYFKTGYLPETGKAPKFGDFTGPGFQEMRNAIAAIDTQFMLLPPKVRKQFGNDPHALISFVNDPANAVKAAEMGLVPGLDPYADPFVPDEPKTPPSGLDLSKMTKEEVDKLREALKADPEAQPSFKKPGQPG